jgi:hypothetical protein
MHTKVYTNWIVAIISVVVAVSCSPRKSIAIEEGWELIGERKVNFVRDVDDVEVTNRTLYTMLRFTVQDKDVRISNVKVFYDNGDKFEPSIDDVIVAGQSSKYIELGREGRYISHIQFKYRTVGGILSGRASVLIFAKKFYRPEY